MKESVDSDYSGFFCGSKILSKKLKNTVFVQNKGFSWPNNAKEFYEI